MLPFRCDPILGVLHLVPSSPGYPLRVILTLFATHVDVDTQENTGASSSGHADKKPDASGHVFALTQDQAANTSDHFRFKSTYLTIAWLEGFLATIHDTTSDVSSIHDQPIVSEFQDVFPEELPGIPPIHDVEFNIELIPRS
ncbi:hypothetical protein Tco_1460624 [Tanacetum coccineum]